MAKSHSKAGSKRSSNYGTKSASVLCFAFVGRRAFKALALAWLGLAFGYDMASRSSSSYKFWPKAPLRSALVPPMVPSRSGSQLWIGFGLRGAFRAIVNFSVRRPVSVDGHKKPSKT